ncbi:MAG: NosD domain-containing protein, partial [Candidatus Hodarchaeales archaeon]
MQKTIVTLLMGIMLMNLFFAFFLIENVKAEGNELYVGGNEPGSYSTIQAAIDDATTDDIIYVRSDTYFENLVINKQIELIGEDWDSTIIDGRNDVIGIQINSDNVKIKYFTIQNAQEQGIEIRSSRCEIIGNLITKNSIGISMIFTSNSNFIYHNNFVDNLVQAEDSGDNVWDDGYPSGGNY